VEPQIFFLDILYSGATVQLETKMDKEDSMRITEVTCEIEKYRVFRLQVVDWILTGIVGLI